MNVTRHLFPRLLPAVATAALVAVLPARAEEYTAWTITGWTDRPEARYQPGEPMKFYFRILNADQPVPGKVRITLAADDAEPKRFMKFPPGSRWKSPPRSAAPAS